MKSKDRPVILLCFGYHRKGWIQIFEGLNAYFEFHYLYYVYPSQEGVSFTNCPKHYWVDYKNAQDLLDKIRPQKVIMMDTGSLLCLATLFCCRSRKIPTFVMQHGLFHDLETNLGIDKKMAQNSVQQKKVIDPFNTRKHTSSFFIKSLRVKDFFNFFRVVKWQLNRRKMFDLEAAQLNRHPYQQADFYIVYTKFNGYYFTELNGVPESKMLEIGVPEFDPFFNNSVTKTPETPYNLIIDSALTYSEELQTNGLVSQESFNAFIKQVNEISLRDGRRLYVKLHPYSYGNKKLCKDDNIVYFEDTDVVSLILNASAVIGFDSTLMIPAVYYKPTAIFFLDTHNYLATVFQKNNLGTVLNYYDFDIEELHKALKSSPAPETAEKLQALFLHSMKGTASERLKKILINTQ